MMAQNSSQELAAQSGDFTQVIDVLTNMFGQVMSGDAIYSVVESCDGDLTNSIEIMMNIVNDGSGSTAKGPENPNEVTSINSNVSNPDSVSRSELPIESTNPQPQAIPQTNMSYASMSKSTGAVPKMQLPQRPIANTESLFWTDQLRRILDYHNKGFKVLILMRGPPGCGKSYLARQIVEMTIQPGDINCRTHICSSDDYFLVRGRYVYNRDRLSDAHSWNQNRVRTSLQQGISPIIIDNTNIEKWEMQPYVTDAVREGYFIEVVEPQTSWARNAYQLFKKNSHNVPMLRIKRMLENYEANVTGDQLLKLFRLSYPAEKNPLVLRVIPEVVNDDKPLLNAKDEVVANRTLTDIDKAPLKNTSEDKKQMENQSSEIESQHNVNQIQFSENKYQETPTVPNVTEASSLLKKTPSESPNDQEKKFSNQVPENVTEYSKVESELFKKYIEVERQIEEFEKVEREWENGENWDGTSKLTVETLKNDEPSTSSKEPKPQRKFKSPDASLQEQQQLSTENDWQDWRNITRFMPDWNPPPEHLTLKKNKKLADVKSTSTCMEIGDTDIYNVNNKYRVMAGTSRDINFYYMPREERIPNKRMLDKSSMTNDQLITEAYRCKNEEKHFAAFRKMFKNISRVDLRDIFDKCCGDVNWAVEIVLDGIASDQLDKLDEDAESDSEEIEEEQCECTAAYNIIPNVSSAVTKETTHEDTELQQPLWKKIKKDKSVSESSAQLKKQIEQNVVIGDNHYSQHCLKIRKIRRGETELREMTEEKPEISQASNESSEKSPEPQNIENVPSTSNQIVPYDYGSDDGSSNSDETEERTFNVGTEFIVQLDDIFDRKDIMYPPNIIPVISMPMSTLNQINALWIESLSHQIETQALYSSILLKQDEECARMIHEKEQELSLAGKEPEVPDFKELMDMDYAMMLYQKDLSEWRNKEPNDMAARMTREKLHNLFPDLEPDTLSELLMAHDNNFQATVEILLASTGRTEILEEKNGINKFIVKKEMERQQKILEEERQKAELNENEWPLLGQSTLIDMGTVDKFRKEAQTHLERRTFNQNKAQDCIKRGMPQVATYYNDIAAFHKKRFDLANSMAATSLIQVNAANKDNTTLDLHYMFVAEAIETLDLFLDHHIQKLRDGARRQRIETLFFITGRGVHSPAGPRIKPAVKRRLIHRGLPIIRNLNPGSVAVDVRGDNKLTHELEST